MEILGALVVLAVLAALLVMAYYITQYREDLKNAQDNAEYWRKQYHARFDEVDRVESSKQELRQVLAATILGNHNNYLAIDPETFEVLPDDFIITKTADVGTRTDSALLVYQVSPREVCNVKLQNQIL